MLIQHRLISLFMVFLMFFHIGACASTTGRTGSTLPGGVVAPMLDAGQVLPVDVVLLGLPVIGASRDDGGGVAETGPAMVLGPGSNGEVITPLARGAQAPFNGVLFNGPAVARVSVEFRGQQERCLIDRRHDVDMVVARYNADMASLQLALGTQARTDQVLLAGRDTDIARLNRLLTASQRTATGPHVLEGLAWAGGGLLLGALLVGGIVITANIRP